MPDIEIKTICVCGAGTMGSGIAQLAAMAGFTTIQFDVQQAMLDKSRDHINAALDKLVNKQKITTEEKDSIAGRITYTTEIHHCRGNLIIEAIVENLDHKVALFNALMLVNEPATIYASNTSSISVTAIAEKTAMPSRLAGMHFFNPAPIMQLVEIVQTTFINTQVTDTLLRLAKQMGKTPVLCKDAPGFIVNRVARHYYLEAMLLVEQGHTDMKTIDTIMEATGFKMGPFALMDLIGLDINYAVSNIVWESLGKPKRLTPSALQKQKVDTGDLGKKTGKGFYSYRG
ncbi:3-hydroxyacyl-CoA dehydrogenase family protein [Limnovirga soli]|uniref:3-hydroxybutyryl-CoA dehydrogenase n=1 Tax=Limnovirga soli TaxID=2656915 RepID=A0A8J8JPY7_9BACT|nr:3-hydroxyacyl-CoA dehydrogenase NAD-binding domain-containing protein [Limnovirga soli]NNV54137.1 3-hydroxybutyryl-CoA dehydrogenase [Limnovirga soli]